MGVEPLSDAAQVVSALGLTSEARSATALSGDAPLPPLPDLRPVLSHVAVSGTTLDGAELASILPTLAAVPPLAAYGRSIHESAPQLAAFIVELPRLSELREMIARAIDEDGALRDHASSRLAQLRRDIRSRRRRLTADLERLVQAGDDRVFAERFVTVRHGRYVVPVRAEARTRIRGIVHDRSQSGQTLFVEPADVVEDNNDLAELAREEESEVARILADLSDAVRADLDDLERLTAGIAEVDWTFARARSAEKMNATEPRLADDRTVALRAARHPLLVAQSWRDTARSVVPVDVELDADRPLLVITGPNAGGKTVALKTLALSAMMAQTGCHVPAADGSRLPIFDSLHAIIGDEQSVAENLSTFSAFVRQVREVLADAGPRSLVLLDELGAGTDPDEGAALAQAILETLADSGALVVASTHLEPLKAFASTNPRARNASVEFDAAKLEPTFRLRYDRPGQSYALLIAGQLGLPPELIERAHAHRSADAARVSQLLERLDEHARVETTRSETIEKQATETAARLAAAEKAESQARTRAREIVDRAKTEAAALLTDVRRAVNTEWDRLKRAERSRATLEDSRRRVRDAFARIGETAAAPEPTTAPVVLATGARVRADHLGLEGEIVAIAGGTATVRAGNVTVRVPVSVLRPAAAADSGRNDAESGRNDRRGPGDGGEAVRGPVGSAARRTSRDEIDRTRHAQGGPRTVSSPSPGRTTITSPAPREIPRELLLLGRTRDEARDAVEKYLDGAFLAGLPSVRVVHGKGTGALRKTVRDLLADHPLVESFRDGEPSEGGAGATVAQLKVS